MWVQYNVVGLDLPRNALICVLGSAKPLIMAKRAMEMACSVPRGVEQSPSLGYKPNVLSYYTIGLDNKKNIVVRRLLKILVTLAECNQLIIDSLQQQSGRFAAANIESQQGCRACQDARLQASLYRFKFLPNQARFRYFFASSRFDTRYFTQILTRLEANGHPIQQ